MRHPIPGQLLDRLIGDCVTGEFIDEFVEAVGFGLDGMGLGDGVAEDVQESELHYFFLSFPRARKETHNQLCEFNVGPHANLTLSILNTANIHLYLGHLLMSLTYS